MKKEIYSASVAPFDQDNKIDGKALISLMQRNLEEGVTGFFVGGSSAECFLLSREERVNYFEVASELNKQTKLIAHVGAIGTDEAIYYAREAKRLGIEKIAATPPYYYRYNAKQVAEYYYEISKAVDMPVLIYNFPMNTSREFDLKNEETKSLFKSEAIWGVKHTNLDIYQLERIKNINSQLKILGGFDETLLAGLVLGIDGAIGSTFNFMFPHYKGIVEAFEKGELEVARILQVKANNIMEAICEVGLISAIKYILKEQGLDVGNPRKPFDELTEQQKVYVKDILEKNLVKGV